MTRKLVLGLIFLTLSACSSPESPGALEGTWIAKEPFPVVVTFRPGQVDALGTKKKVSYRTEGTNVFVTYLEGPTKGKVFRYEVLDADTLRSETGIFHRSGNKAQ